MISISSNKNLKLLKMSNMTQNQKTLIRKAMKKHPNEVLFFCSDKTNWNDCFMEYDLKEGKKLAFYYNLKNGGTYTELLNIED